jgi:hypothetical protein
MRVWLAIGAVLAIAEHRTRAIGLARLPVAASGVMQELVRSAGIHVAVVVALVVVGCSAPTVGPSASASASVASCPAAEAEGIVRAFVGSFSAGTAVDPYLSPAFVEYFVGTPAERQPQFGRDAALRYIETRQRAGDRMTLISLLAGTGENPDGAWGFSVEADLQQNGESYRVAGKAEALR